MGELAAMAQRPENAMHAELLSALAADFEELKASHEAHGQICKTQADTLRRLAEMSDRNKLQLEILATKLQESHAAHSAAIDHLRHDLRAWLSHSEVTVNQPGVNVSRSTLTGSAVAGGDVSLRQWAIVGVLSLVGAILGAAALTALGELFK